VAAKSVEERFQTGFGDFEGMRKKDGEAFSASTDPTKIAERVSYSN
jgi:hypothetical protein